MLPLLFLIVLLLIFAGGVFVHPLVLLLLVLLALAFFSGPYSYRRW